VGLLVLVWTGSGRGGEAGMGMAMLIILAAIPTAAVTLFGAGMLSFVLWGMVGSLE
jgi:hypothetical protein